MSIETYRENLHEAQRKLDIAQTVKDGFKAQGLIKWGMSARGFEGWLVEGKKADEAYSQWQLARCEVEHWGFLTNQATRLRSVPQDSRLPPEKDDDEPMTAEEVERRKADLSAQFEEWQARNQSPEATP